MTVQRAVTPPARSPLRWPAAAAALVIAAAHIPVTAAHLTEAPYIGWAFVALEISVVVLAVVLVVHDAPLAWWTGTVVPTLAIAAYVLTRSVALPQIADDVGNWTEPLGIVAVTAEALLLVMAVIHRNRSRSPPRLVAHPLALAGILLALGLAATVYAVSLSDANDRTGSMHDDQGAAGMPGMASTLPPLRWSSFLDQWHVRPWWLLFSVLSLTGYLAAVALARRRSAGCVHPARVASFVAGIGILLFTVSSAVDIYARALFWDHMIEHLLLIMVVPALLVIGHPITVVRAAATQSGAEAVDAFGRSWPVSILAHPLVAFCLYAVVIVATHLTGFMDAMSTRPWVMGAEQWLYLTTGYVYLLALLGSEPVRARLPYLGRVGLLLLGMVPDTVVGIVLMQTTSDVFPRMEGGHPPWAPAPVEDVHIGGALMWVGGDGLMMLFGVAVTIAMITHPRSPMVIGQRLEQIRRRTLAEHVALGGRTVTIPEEVDVDEDEAILEAYNQMLARMSGSQPPTL